MTSAKWMRGFTLIEMLVVMAILGVLTTAVALTTRSDPRRAATADAQRLALLLEAAQVEAQAGKRLLAWSANPSGYGFWEAENTLELEHRWQPVTEDETFRSRRLAEGLHITRVDIDGQALPEGGLLVFRRSDPPLFHIALDFSGTQDDAMKPIELRGLPTGRVEMRSAAD